jgi:hypothetical protein
MAMARLKEAGATIEEVNFRIEGFPVDAQVSGINGRTFLVLARGTPDEQDRSALRRTDTVEKAGFMAMQLARHQPLPIILITSDLPKRSTKAGHYLAALADDLWDVVSYRADLKGFHDCGLTSLRQSRKCRRMHPGGLPKRSVHQPCSTNPATAMPARAPNHIARQWATSATSSRDGATDGGFRSHESGVDRHSHGRLGNRERDLDSSRIHRLLENQTLLIKTRKDTRPPVAPPNVAETRLSAW